MDDPIENAARTVRDARRLVILTGAGVSTESGVPDFRSPGGIWSTFSPSDFEYERFVDDPRRFWELRTRLMRALDLDRVKPNMAHDAIAHASGSSRFLGHVTQNIDGLFLAAGHKPDKLVEIHGSARKVNCLSCRAFFPYEVARASVDAGVLPPRCPRCEGPLKPGTILFGERLPEDALDSATAWMRHADVVLVVGSSLVVHPAAALPAIALDRGAVLLIVNEDATSYDDAADVVLRGKAGMIVPRILGGFD